MVLIRFSRYRAALRLLLGIAVITAIFPMAVAAVNLERETASGFKIIDLGNRVKKVIDSDGRALLLVPRGQKVPSGIQATAVIRTPLTRAVYASMTQVCLLRPLRDPTVWRSVVGVTNPRDQWFIPEIKAGLKSHAIKYVGDGYNPDYELIQSLRPELVFIYTGTSGQYKLLNMLRRLRIPYLVDNEYLENDPLKKLSWLRMIAAFYNKEREAEVYIRRVQNRITRLRRRAASVRPAAVAWGMVDNGKVFVPGAESFTGRLIGMAGGRNVFQESVKGVESVPISMEEFFARAGSAKYLILPVFPETAPSIAALVRETPVLTECDAVKQGRVWAIQPWFFQLVDRPDEVLRDLIKIIHPSLDPRYRLRHFRKIPPK